MREPFAAHAVLLDAVTDWRKAAQTYTDAREKRDAVIRELRASGYSTQTLGAHFTLAQRRVQQILKGTRR